MLKIFRNILEIIGEMSNCDAGYLVKIDSGKSEILASFIESGNLFVDIKEYINKLQKSGSFSKEEFYKLTSFNNSANTVSPNSSFIKELQSEKQGICYYLVFLSQEKENFNEANFARFSPLINNFYNIIKEYDSSTLKYGQDNKHGNSIDLNGNRILKFFFEASDDFVFILDKDGYIISVNECGAASLYYETAEIEGKHFIELVAQKNKKVLAESFQKIINDDKLITFEAILLSKFGNEIIFQINCKRLKNEGDEFKVIGVGKNITVLRNYKEKINELNVRLIEANRLVSIEKQRSKRQKTILLELNRLKSEFVSNISHELRTPLASIIGFSETISSEQNMPDDMRNEFNEIILNEGKRLAKLINEMLDISRLEGGQVELNESDFDSISLLEEVIESNKKALEKKEIILTKDIPAEPAIIKGDKEKISKSLNNLLNNAIKFTPHKGRIIISALSLYKELEITISDTGVGIPEKDLPYIFQKFYRVSRPGTEIPGTGLGLVFVKQIVDLHKGFITIQSEVNKGTTVILKLPKDSKV
jgi:PAS domain S-box-containing protein